MLKFQLLVAFVSMFALPCQAALLGGQVEKSSLAAEYLIEIASIIIAFSALAFTILQGFQNRKHYRLSVKPFLTDRSIADERTQSFTIYYKNLGLGPAIIDRIDYSWAGKAVSSDELDEIIHPLITKGGSYDMNHFICNDALSPSEESIILSFVDTSIDREQFLEIIDTIKDNLTVSVLYTCMYTSKHKKLNFSVLKN